MCNKIVSKNLFMLKLCFDIYNTIFTFLSIFRFIPDWFVTNRMIKKLYNALFFINIFFANEDSGIVSFPINDIDFNTIDLNDDNFDKDNSETYSD